MDSSSTSDETRVLEELLQSVTIKGYGNDFLVYEKLLANNYINTLFLLSPDMAISDCNFTSFGHHSNKKLYIFGKILTNTLVHICGENVNQHEIRGALWDVLIEILRFMTAYQNFILMKFAFGKKMLFVLDADAILKPLAVLNSIPRERFISMKITSLFVEQLSSVIYEIFHDSWSNIYFERALLIWMTTMKLGHGVDHKNVFKNFWDDHSRAIFTIS
jgi:hypothetical protein